MNILRCKYVSSSMVFKVQKKKYSSIKNIKKFCGSAILRHTTSIYTALAHLCKNVTTDVKIIQRTAWHLLFLFLPGVDMLPAQFIFQCH